MIIYLTIITRCMSTVFYDKPRLLLRISFLILNREEKWGQQYLDLSLYTFARQEVEDILSCAILFRFSLKLLRQVGYAGR